MKRIKLSRKTLAIIIVLTTLVITIIIFFTWKWLYLPKITTGDYISQTDAFKLIDNCKVVGTYSVHSGEAGIILKPADGQPALLDLTDPTTNFRAVRGATKDQLLLHENKSCPFTTGAIE